MQKLKAVLKITVLLAFILLGLTFVFPAENILGNPDENNVEYPFSGEIHLFSPSNSTKFKGLPPSYPLTVRGGRGLRITFENTKNDQLVKMIIEFTFSTRKAGDGLRSGQGAWQDRGGRTGEPTRLEFYNQKDDAKKIFDYLQSVGNYYTFECFNSGKGYLQITKAYVKSVRID